MAKRKLTLIIAVVLIIAALTAVFLILRPSSPPRPALEEALSTIEQPSDSGLISGAAFENFSAVISGDPRQSFRTASAEVRVTYLDTAALADGSMDKFVAEANELAGGNVYEGLLDNYEG